MKLTKAFQGRYGRIRHRYTKTGLAVSGVKRAAAKDVLVDLIEHDASVLAIVTARGVGRIPGPERTNNASPGGLRRRLSAVLNPD
ncbi:hypothetical protein LJR175_007985 [Variovorax sp. LjRoot175]|uniref:hypothetical protein n=1 Tax=Variovorax sp. LjRoot175 TaxID=3342276 RepID=UPI003ECD05EE